MFSLLFYINYEECKSLKILLFSQLTPRFILTMRNVNDVELANKVHSSQVLY